MRKDDDKPIDISQEKIIKQLILFMAKDRGILSLPKKEAKLYLRGLCHGFAIVQGFMAAAEKGIWWQAVLKTISQANPADETTLAKEASLPNAENPKETLHSVFLRATHYLRISDATSHKTGIENISQTDFLFPKEKTNFLGFESSTHTVFFNEKAAGYFSPTDIATLLDETIFDQKGIFLAKSVDHACAIAYYDQKWHFYDPNKPDGDIAFTSKSDFINHLVKTLGYSLCFEIASFDPAEKNKMDAFAQQFQQLCDQKPNNMIEDLGLHQMAKHAPTQLQTIIQKADNDAELREKLVFALTKKNSTGQTGLGAVQDYTLIEINENALFSHNEKPVIFDELLTHLRENNADCLLHLQTLLITEIEMYLHKHPNSPKTETASALQLAILNAKTPEEINTLLKNHPDNRTSSSLTLLSDIGFASCLKECIESVSAYCTTEMEAQKKNSTPSA